MSKLKTYSEFINEGMIDAVKNPIKWKKIKNNAKKFQKAKVAHALNDVDYAKKLASSDTKKETDVLKKTNDVKNASLKDMQSNISTRMDDLATTPGLQQVVKLAKNTSNLAANKIIIKAATGEQAKQLKIKQKALVGKVADAKAALKDYETTEKPKEEESESDKLAAKNELEKEEKAKKDNEVADDETTKKPETKTEKANKEKKQALAAKIEDAMNAIEKANTQAKTEVESKAAKQKEYEAAKGTDKENVLGQELAAFTNSKKSRDSAIKDLKANINDLQKQQKELDESARPLVESVSEKFKRLRANL
jgi:hypothetical protein